MYVLFPLVSSLVVKQFHLVRHILSCDYMVIVQQCTVVLCSHGIKVYILCFRHRVFVHLVFSCFSTHHPIHLLKDYAL